MMDIIEQIDANTWRLTRKNPEGQILDIIESSLKTLLNEFIWRTDELRVYKRRRK